jgi:hypothetical protein
LVIKILDFQSTEIILIPIRLSRKEGGEMDLKTFLRQRLQFTEKFITLVWQVSERAKAEPLFNVVTIHLTKPTSPETVIELVEQYWLLRGYQPRGEWQIRDNDHRAKWDNGILPLVLHVSFHSPAQDDLVIASVPLWQERPQELQMALS